MPIPTAADTSPESYAANHATEFSSRKQYAENNILSKIRSKNGIIAFDVSGWGDASGHFTLWEGSTEKLFYVGADSREKDKNSPLYYFWYVSPTYDGTRYRVVQTTAVSFWELK